MLWLPKNEMKLAHIAHVHQPANQIVAIIERIITDDVAAVVVSSRWLTKYRIYHI